MNEKVVFIGHGVMAEAMIGGLIRQNVTTAEAIVASGPRVTRGDYLKKKFGINAVSDNKSAVKSASVVILSIKPQHIEKVLDELNGRIEPTALILSIVAGAPMKTIAHRSNHGLVVRAMPNTPAQIGEGITVWTALKEVDESQRELARKILAALGDEIYLEEEYFLDMATALSGTGPAYVFLFMEAMVDAGVHLGFPRRIAEQLVAQTVRGSVEYFQSRSDPVHLARLRNQVTSPSGTSAAALYYLEKAGLRTAISRAVWAAYQRSKELGQKFEIHPPDPE